MKKKKIILLFLAFLLLYILWMSYHILSFKTYKTPSSNHSSLEIEGVYHIHTLFSDGRKSPDKIIDIASLASIDFIILTDHGNPNYESLASQGWKNGVLVLAGSELSVSRGHLVALGFQSPPHPFSQNTEKAVYEIDASGGFSIIAHPFSKTSWSWGKFVDYSGLEIMNSEKMLRKDLLLSLPFLPMLLVKPEYFLLKILDRPHKNLRKWDELNNLHPLYGYFSTDAHLLYRPLFQLFRLHLLLKTPLSSDFETARLQVYETLKRGRFYNAVHAAAQANGFRFWGEQGKKKIPMGRKVLLDSPVTLHAKAPFPFSKETHLIHNGKIILSSIKESISYKAIQPGTYRVEIYLTEKSPMRKNIPWILSNPIFLQEEKK